MSTSSANPVTHDPSTPANYHALVRSIAQTLRQRCTVPEGATLLIACSGGADSVALLRALHLLAPRRGYGHNLHVGHIVHRLRDDDSDLADAAFVRELAAQLDLPYHQLTLNPAIRPPDKAMTNDEAWARRARDAALVRLAGEASCTHIATAHHADDQIETFLARVLRGTTLRGLSGIAYTRPPLMNACTSLRVVRPMLDASRADALDFLNTLHQPWREDPTNHDTTKLRARLRRDVLPTLHELSPQLATRVQKLADEAGHLNHSNSTASLD